MSGGEGVVMKEVYISVDIETDGPIPGQNSMLSLGAAEFDPLSAFPEGPKSTFYRNLVPLGNAVQDPKTMEWWAKQPKEAWKRTLSHQQSPIAALIDFRGYLKSLSGKPVFVAWPATWDFMFIQWYFIYFLGACPFGISGLDLKTFAFCRLAGTERSFRGTSKKILPEIWKENLPPHTHNALDDAIEQGILFVRMMRER